MSRLPTPGSDKGTWGGILNDFLGVEHNADGTLKSSGSLAGKADTSSLSTVATTGSYTDLTNKPTIPSSPVTSVATRTGDVVLTKTDVGLGSVDNTSDASKNTAVATLTNKIISGASNTLSNIPESAITSLTSDLAALAPLASPTFTGTPVAPTATAGNNTTQMATTAFVGTAITNAALPDATTSSKGKVQLATASDVVAATGNNVLTAGLVPSTLAVTGVAKVQFIANGGTVTGSPGAYTIIIEAAS